MKTLYKSLLIFILALAFVACDNDTENIGYVPPLPQVDYDALKAYKASDHEITFGWFGGWSGPSGTMASSLMSLPDSVDMVSNWGQPWPLTDAQIADMKNVQQTKGTKILACIFTPYLGRYLEPEEEAERLAFWGWSDTDTEQQAAAIRKYAKAMAEEIIKWGYDGLDIDHEPEFQGYPAHMWGSRDRFYIFIDELSKYLGPKSKSGKILAIDGYVWQNVTPDMADMFDYFILQAYYETSYSRYDSRFNQVVNTYTSSTREELAKKIILTEDFERHSGDGGGNFLLRDGSYTRSSLGMAYWRPLNSEGVEIPKGGAGLYHIEYDYRNAKYPYYYTRQMTSIMNPVKGDPETGDESTNKQ